MAGYSHKTWTCPFFTWDERLRIHCECGCLGFPDWKAICDYAAQHCASTHGWKSCTLAAHRLQYYDRNELETNS